MKTTEHPRRCCCPTHDRYDCMDIRYGQGWDPEDAFTMAREACECVCHDEWEDAEDDDDDAR